MFLELFRNCGMNSTSKAAASAAEDVTSKIFDLILSSELTVLPSEGELCVQLNSSRTTVRAALQTLQAQGIIIKQPKKKTTIAPKENWDWFDPRVIAQMDRCYPHEQILHHVGALRLSFEPNAAALCALNCQMGDLVEIERGCTLMKEGVAENAPHKFEEGDILFHRSIFIGTKNPFFMGLQSLIINTSILSISSTLDDKPLESSAHSLDKHLALFSAIRFKRPDEARTVMRTILLDSLNKIFPDKLPDYVDFIK